MLKFFVVSFSLLIFPVTSIVNRGKGTFSNYNQREVNGEYRQFHESDQNGSPNPAVEDERFFWDESENPVADQAKMKHQSSSVSQQRVDNESPYIWKDSSDELHRDSRVHVIKEESHSVETTHHLKTDHDDNGASNGYGSYQADGWRPIKSSKQGGRNYNYYSKTSKKGGAFVSGSCETRLTAPMNSILRCSSYSGCQATCLRDYQFPNGETQLFFACQEGKWRVRGSTDDEIPQCHPSCLPPCQNGGICTSPNTCQCSQTFFGPYCQYEKKACTDTPPTPNNSKKICNSESCTIQCLPNHQFSDGSAIANVFCKEGVWIPGRPDWKTVPDCKPVCSPPCLNGGSCMTNNLCQCPQQYRGSQCQYSVDVCDARKLNFNGNYNCSGNGDYFSCSLTCPLGMSFASNVAIGQIYTCDYATGTFMPSLVPQCVFGAGMDPNSNYHLSSHTLETINITKKTETNVGYLDLNKLFVLEKKPPSPGSCSIWGGSHYKTFDGSIVSFKSGCLYTLVSDLKDNKFHVQTQNTETDCLGSGCTRSFNIYINDILYRLLLNDAGMPEVRTSLQNFTVPSQLPDLRVDISGKMVITTLQSLNVKMVWNQKDLVDVEVGEELWNSTGGLCGTMDGHSTNDLTEFHESVVEYAEKWSVQTFGEVCQSKVVDALECGDAETQQAAHEFCNKIMIDPKFKQCRNIVMVREFYDACRWDFCACKQSSLGATNCACESIEMFVKECAKKGVTDIATWRDSTTCPMQCSGGKIYMSCGPATEATCRSQQSYSQPTHRCEEGCFCPEGTLAEDGRCILPKDCPCQLRGKSFKAGATVPSDCNTCTCVEGQWSCTDLLCTARCEAVGDPHYRTFDGRHYDFMGKCSYHLLRTDNFSISAENVACDGTISEAFGHLPSKSPSCTKAVTVQSNDGKTVIKLKQNKLITVNGEEVTAFPIMMNDIFIRAASSIFVQVELPDEINILWDGYSRVYIHVSPNLKGKTQGLCGTFNGMQKDDFMTPEGDIEQDISSFADKWKAKETCDNISDQDGSEKTDKHPCDVKVQNRELAEAYCSNLTSRLFADCHMFVDPMPYYQNCLYDLCSCRSRKMSDCFCPMLAAYAKQCADQGAIIEWRGKVRECGLQCTGGQVYSVCGDSCTRTCQDIAGRGRSCRKECVDGCNCPEGRALDSRGDCVPISSCHCLREGMEYPPGHKDIQRSSKGLKLCKCESGAWNCKLATQEEIAKYPNEALEHKITCSSKKFQEFTHCLPAEPITCKNMHNYHNLLHSSAICRSGCICKRGFVLDSLTRECVKPTQCPCHHGGRSYADGEEIKESCNKCTCKASKWQCTEHLCPSVCTTWGDSHFKTFDGKFYDFQGACDYVLSKGMISVNESFTVTLEIVPCGTSGVSCPKSVILTIHSGGVHESIQFSKHKPLPSSKNLKKITVREAGLFTFADVVDQGIVVQWDKGTRVTVKADLKWKNRLKGLCGNYNDNEADDFQTPAGGIAEVSSTTFGDSWKLHPYCPEAFAVKDTCEVHPNRRSWAIEKCGILKSPIFKPCHSEVPVGLYLDRCIFDTCGCDQGGDCECLCTAIAAYAEQCNLEGVPIKWRTQHLCPMQCDEKCSEYKACTQTCPVETCDNLLTHATISQLCRQDSCVEGCERKPCPAGQIYQNATSYECIPVALCKPICTTEDGQEYYEGDIVEQDACHTCFCSHHKKVCTGTPCTTEVILSSTSFLNLTTMTVTTTILPEVNINDQLVCVPGWTDWINKHHPSLKEPNFDFENASAIDIMHQISQPIDSTSNKKSKPQCGKNEMVEIQCREVETKRHYKELGQDVVCTIDGGLICSDPNKCNDYEIRVLCQCKDSVTIPSQTTTTPSNEVELLSCNISNPLTKHPTNCFKYFQCEETTSGSFVQVERECTLNLWFNPETLTCDWPHSVLKIRPECEEISETINTNVGCVDTWSDWLNISSPRNSGGDFELISVMQREHIDICTNNGYIKDIECQFVKIIEKTRSGKYGEAFESNFEYHNVKESPDVDVTCDKNLGLECVNDKQPSKMCQDYRIRVLCACEEKKEEQMNEKANEQAPVTETVYQDCRSDEVYNDCLIKCDQLCHYYEHTLPRYTEYCSFKSRKQCLPGCSSLSNPVNCSTSGQRWRDFSTCVATNDCTCRSHNGTIVKPGQVIWESNCEACQCLNNHYVCDTSECLKTTVHSSSHVVTSTIAPSTSPEEITTTTESHYSTMAEDIIYTSEAYETTKTTQNIFILTSTVSPPPLCNKDSYKPLLGGKGNVHLTSSSNSNFSKPEYGILIENNAKNWKPSINNQEQYLEINLGQIAPVYSIITAGDEHSGEFVTSYYVLYSIDGHTFSYVMDGAEPQLFRGPLTSLLTMQQEFRLPVEGQYFRINPNSWKEGIAMRVQLFGCSNEVATTISSTVIPTTTSRTEPVCTDRMGVESGAMRNKQISVSSHLDENFQAHDMALSSDRGWAPLIDSPHQWVQFDFLEERTITGVVTKGGSVLVDGNNVENAWVEAYKVAYSHDGSKWSFIMEESDQPVKKVFVGNFDVNSPHKNFFNLPIHARYLRIYPLKWHRSILLKIEILGCFVQYPEDMTTIRPEPIREEFSTTSEPEKCLVCLGITFEGDSCPCLESTEKYWDGEKCSPKAQCPCVVGHLSYQVGSVYFETEECSTCTCTFGGISACSKQECPSCGEGKMIQRSSQCECLCVECDEGTRLCPTSNICINSTSWCDGFVDCPDDEKNCTVYVETSPVETTTPQSTTTVETKQLRCPPAECPPGFKVKLIMSDNEESNDLEDLFSSGKFESTPAHASKSKWGSHFNKHGRGFHGGGLQSHWGRGDSFWSNGQYSHHRSSYSSYHTTRYHSHSYHGHHHGKTGSKFSGNHYQSKNDVDSDIERCPEYECIPIKKQNKVCVTPVCTKGYDLIEVESFSKTEDKCPKYVCKLTPMPDARCNITGRTFNTFDGLEFKYDVCDHVLAQSMADSNWQIRLVRTCSYIGPCKKSLKIKNFNNTIIFNTDMSVVYNGYDYTVEQCGKIGGQSLEFAIKKISDKFIIFKSILDFSVIWDMQGNVKIVVPHKFVGNVNGLCGLFDDYKENDRQKPDRTFAHSTIEFGDSWGNTESCETKVCPIEIQNKAWEMCMNVKKAPLAICGNVINFDKYLSQCVESICNCLEGHTSKVNTTAMNTEVEKCKCDALLDFVTECQESNPGIDISNWRVVNNCPVDCPAPFIYKECYNRICEMGCDDLMDDNPCPTSEGSCFPGCYCPDGLIREKDSCVKPLDCQDCVCDGFGKTRYVTFDRADYTFNSNCTYKLVETVPEFNEGPKFTILATTGLCDYENGKTESTCIKSLTFVYGVHSAQVGGLSTKDNYHKLYLKTNIGEKTQKFPYRNRWIEVQENNGNGLLIHLVTTHVKVLFYGRDKGFSIHIPSQLYFNNTQGLCGRCNRNETDDFLTSDGVVQTENIELFGKSWRAIGVSSIIGEEKECDVIPQKEIECLPPPPDQDNCMKLLNGAIFGQCHAVIDPAPYVASCHESYCHEKESLDMCAELHSYARECMSAGICVDWRAQLECTHQCAPGLVYKPCSPGCLETCDNYNLLREKPEMCTDPNIEACVCPPGQVLLNGSCVLESRCQPCDTEGHYPGDEWHPDACTTCSCQSATTVHCQRTECPTAGAILCQAGYRMVMQRGTEADCCPRFICAPDTALPELMCNDTAPVRPDCGQGQRLKLDVDSNGCEHYLCECKPASECEDTANELNKTRNAGLVAVLVETGCCPEVKVICKKQLCQQPPSCQKYFELQQVLSESADACCPTYSCEAPKDKCLYEFEFIEEPNSGVRKRNPNERYIEAKSGGEVWYDGPCHKCECSPTDFKSHCTTKQCSLPTTDSADYVVETMHISGQCCPVFIRTACKVDDTIYQEGEVWRSPSGDPCKNYTCVKNEDSKITKQDIVETCKKDCRKGWKYVEPSFDSKECCGQCQPFACVIDDEREMALNSVWYSEDNCTTYTCSAESDQVLISSSQQLCPPLEDCPEENIIKDGCCQKCNQTTPLAQSICAPESLPANETLKLVRHLDVNHGLCQNIDVLDKFTECRGACDSYTYYNKDTESHDSKCQCCQAVKYDSIQVSLSCEDGSMMEKAVFVPAKCVCMNCGA